MSATYRNQSTRGFLAVYGPVPWAWTRRVIADRWHCPPWLVDEAPQDEVLLELELMRIDSEERPGD